MLSQVYLILFISSLSNAEIVAGKCPTVPGTNYSCAEIIGNFYKVEKPLIRKDQINLLIYGFVPASYKTQSFNIFAFEFSSLISISDFYAILNCGETKDFLRFYCGYHIPMQPLHQIGIDFSAHNIRTLTEEKFVLLPRISEDNNEKCKSYETKKFDYVIRTSPKKYIVIWGCYQINETFYDRGLWIFGANKNQSDFKVVNVEQMIDEALKDMNLDQEIHIKKKMVINKNIFEDQSKKCPIERFYFDECKNRNVFDGVSFGKEQLKQDIELKNNNEKNVMLFVLSCLVFLAIAVGAFAYCVLK